MGKSYRLPNGFGSTYKLSGNRRRPWVAAKTFGWDRNGRQIKKIIGYAENKKDALQILTTYNNNPLSSADLLLLTFELAYEKWMHEIETGKIQMSESNKKAYKSAFKNCQSLHKIRINDLKTSNVQEAIDECKLGYASKRYIKLLASKLNKYCKVQLDMNNIRDFAMGLILGNYEKSNIHIPFSHQEIVILWQNLTLEYIDSIIVSIYTGVRPSELLKIELDKINIDEKYFIEGIKTKAGIDRPIPIHKDIEPIIRKKLETNKKYLFEKDGKKINYRYYLDKFKEILKKLLMDHLPHDGRHTLATEFDNINANEVCVKIILGHKIDDITKGVYTHKLISQLVETINQINYIDDYKIDYSAYLKSC